ncbi:MAG: DUF523 domain-containing protein [Candidatus Aenigmarchaeota archaeon]|nr:DUF523 domain-containing protein [Candidatus Aenigmarchaeota archaeon]
MTILVSACLLGCKCRYNGNDSFNKKVVELYGKDALRACPEQIGGLSTPRESAEIVGDRVLTEAGEDLTEAFECGAERTLYIAQSAGVKRAILRHNSPSCGCGRVYDGTFTGRLADGYGVTARLLMANGIECVSDDSI